LLSIAARENRNVTSIFREALADFVKTREETGATTGPKMDEYLGESVAIPEVVSHRILTPVELRHWTDKELLDTAKLVRARKQEVDHALRTRNYYFTW